jgi:Flp pilus assembly protein CpaB
LLGLALALVAASGSIAYWGVATDTRGVLVATRELPAGTTLAAGDLAVARVHLDDALYAAALPANELAPTVGRRLADPAHTGQVLARGQLATHPLLGPDQLALTIAVRPETAAGGRLRPGDHVRVLVTRDEGKPDSSTATVLERVVVYEVGYDPRLSAGAVGNGQAGESESGPLASVTLVVTPEQATQLANAKWNGDLDVALLPPDPSSATPTPADTR